MRKVINDPSDCQKALELERRAMLALVTRLINDDLPYARVRALCALVASDISSDERDYADRRPGVLWGLAAEALEPMGRVIDARIESER